MFFKVEVAVARGLSIDGANRCIFTVCGATARIAAYLQCRRADVHRFPRKYAVAMLGLVAPLPEGLLLHFPSKVF